MDPIASPRSARNRARTSGKPREEEEVPGVLARAFGRPSGGERARPGVRGLAEESGELLERPDAR